MEDLDPVEDCKEIKQEALTSISPKRKWDHDTETLQCNLCEYEGSKRALHVHKKSKHDGLAFPCDQCEFISIDQTSLRRHRQGWKKIMQVRFCCSI